LCYYFDYFQTKVKIVDDYDTCNVQKAIPLGFVPDEQKGEFKYGLCGCCDSKICCGALWWNLFCIRVIPVAQLLNRFGWDACAVPRTKQIRWQTFIILCAVFAVSSVSSYVMNHFQSCHTATHAFLSNDDTFSSNDDFLSFSMNNTTKTNTTDSFKTITCKDTPASFVAHIVYWSCFVYLIILFIRIRERFRKHYNIHGTFCGDFWTMLCCNCCAIAQMLRQTHDESEYPYSCCNCLTGLPDDTPEIPNDFVPYRAVAIA